MHNPGRILEPFALDIDTLFAASMSDNTWRAYETGLNSFETFRTLYKLSFIWPPPVYHLINYVGYLCHMSYSPATIRLYIAGVSFATKCKGLLDTTQSFLVQKIIKGANNLHHQTDISSPITINMLSSMPLALQHVCASRYEALLFTAAFSLSFFGLLRVGEIAISSIKDVNRLIQNTDIDFCHSFDSLFITVRFSKTDQSGQSCALKLDRDSNPLICPISTLQSYLIMRPAFTGPLFCHYNKKPITRTQFVSVLHKALHFMGYPKNSFNSHSFRIGGATNLFINGTSEELIKQKGRCIKYF